MSESDGREKLLLQMYDQMFNDINRHIMVVWQSVGVLVGAFAIFALAEKEIITFDVASTLIVLVSGWSIAHLFDASYWYNRNLAIIANIEKQFLQQKDLSQIHYYFGSHRPDNKMITHLKIQVVLSVGIVVVILIYHLYSRVVPGIGYPWSRFDLVRTFPYICALILGIYLCRLHGDRKRSYKEFLANSPGIAVDTTGISYGEGHGFPKS